MLPESGGKYAGGFLVAANGCWICRDLRRRRNPWRVLKHSSRRFRRTQLSDWEGVWVRLFPCSVPWGFWAYINSAIVVEMQSGSNALIRFDAGAAGCAKVNMATKLYIAGIQVFRKGGTLLWERLRVSPSQKDVVHMKSNAMKTILKSP